MGMLSFRYLCFLGVTIIVWYGFGKLVRSKRITLAVRNLALLSLCVFFYLNGSVGGIFVLLFQIISGFMIGKSIGRIENARAKRILFIIAIIINLSVICIFKYLDFLLQPIGLMISHNKAISWLAPLGVSFYSLEIIAYIANVYHGKMTAESNVVDFALFISFFPTILSGPIERPERILPQLKTSKPLCWDDIYIGMTMIISGFFRKMVIADQLAAFTDEVFANTGGRYSGAMFIIATIAYTVQIYCDFSGYSEVAIGSARMLGIHLYKNFDIPYFSRSIKEFWRRWHISLSSWFRDFLYIPLGGNKHGLFRKCLNTFIVFLVSGLWHGANWTFLLWGAIHGIYMIVEMLLNLDKKEISESSSYGRTIFTFILVAFAWIPFRANSVADYGKILRSIALTFATIKSFSEECVHLVDIGINSTWLLSISISLFVLFVQDWYRKSYQIKLYKYGETNVICSVSFNLVLVLLILLFGVYGPMYSAKEFIYFQF